MSWKAFIYVHHWYTCELFASKFLNVHQYYLIHLQIFILNILSYIRTAYRLWCFWKHLLRALYRLFPGKHWIQVKNNILLILMPNSHRMNEGDSYFVWFTLKKIRLKETQIEKMHFMKVNLLKLSQVELFLVFHFACAAANASELFCMAHLANKERFLYHSIISF